MRTSKANGLWRHFAGAVMPVILGTILWTTCGRPPAVQIENPYAGVDWSSDIQSKSNLHTHTTVGGARDEPQTVIDRYRELGYGILALTDHDDDSLAEPTWPWQEYGREPEALEMVAIQGNEISEVNHIGSHFCDYGDPDAETEEEALEEIGDRGGTALLHHPGRYNRSVDWYADLYRQYDHLLGQEVYNRNDRYPGDRQKWDSILTVIVPDRFAWGFASDDMHNLVKDIGISWNVIIVPELTSALVRQALEKGCFFFVNSPRGLDGSPAPVVEAITVDEQSGTIRIKASGHEQIVWISQGRIVHRGDRLRLGALPELDKYVRAEISGADGTVIGTQPFGITRLESQD